MKPLNYINRADMHYLKDERWADGTLCYWRDNPQYSAKEKAKLELRLKNMLDRNHKLKAKLK